MSRKQNQNKFKHQFQILSRLVQIFWQAVISVFGGIETLINKQNQQKAHKRNLARYSRFGRSLFTAIVTLILTISLSGINLWLTSPAYAAGLYIEPITWDFIGLDSNNVNAGPNNFLLAARVCNTSGSTLTNINIQYVRTGAYNPYITVTAVNGINIDTLNVPSLPSGSIPPNHQKIPDSGNLNITPANCFDGYFNAVVTRTSAAYNTVQQYKIVASAAGAGSVDTNTALSSGISGYAYGQTIFQQLYVEKLISQSRNAVVSFVGPTNIFVGDTVEYILTTTTATAYPQLTVSSDFPNGILQLVDVKTTYTSDLGAVSSGVYFDACGWLADPSNPGYHTSANTCGGPVGDQDSNGDGKVGNTVTTRYRVKVLSTGGGSSNNLTVKHLINDFSGGSFHYNADYGTGLGMSTITVNDSTTDLQIIKSHTGNFATGSNTYQLQVKNNGPADARGTLTVVDTLPTGFSYVSASTTGTGLAAWTCSASGQIVTCTNPNTSNFLVNATSTIALTVNVSASANSYSLNTATVTSGSPDSNLANNSSSDPTTVLSGANISLTKTHSPATFIVGSTGTYTLTVSNSSAFDGIGPIVIADKLPTGISYISGSGASISYPATTAPSGCSIAAGTVTCPWTVSASGQNVTFQNNANLVVGASSIVTLNVAIGSSALSAAIGPSGFPEVINTATATTTNFDPSTSNNTATDNAPVKLPVPDLSITKTHIGNFIKDGRNTYTVTVTNAGVQPTTGAIDVVDTFPAGAGMTYQSVSGTNWSCKTTCTVGNTGPVTFTNPGPLAVGQSTSFVVTVIAPTIGTFNTPGNQVDVTTPGDTTAGGNNRATDPTTVVAPPTTNSLNVDEIITKTITTSPTPANARQVVYKINLRESNLGGQPTDPVVFTDVIPSQITFIRPGGITCTVLDSKSVCGTESGSGQTITYTGMTLNKNTTGLNIVVTGTLSAGFTGTISNTGTVQPNTVAAPGAVDVNPADNTSTASFTYNEADLTIAKTPPAANVIRSGTANYTIAVTNSGTGPTSGLITVTDTLNSNLTFVQGSSAALSSGWSCSNVGQLVTCTNPGPLAAGASSSISLQVTVSATATLVPTTPIPNTASVSTPGEVNTSNNTSTIANVTPIAANSDLIISKSGPATTNLGQTLTYTLTVTNQGTTTAVASTNPITVTDTLQSGLTFLSGTGSGWSCSAAAQLVTCTSNTDLAPSATSVITLNALVGTSTVSPINNNSSVALTGETVTNNNTSNTVVTTINQSADLSIVKSHTGNFVLGQSSSYQLLVTNNGPSSVLSTITVTDTLPNDLAFTGSTGGGFTCSAGAKVNGTPQVVTCTNSTGLVVGTSATITLNVTVGAATPSSITNTASVSSAVSDPVNSNNSSNDPTTVSPLQADLKLTKTHFGAFAIAGQGTYTLSVENLGPALATGTLTITDVLPVNLTLASFIGQGWNCVGAGANPQTVTCTNTNLTGLASGSITAVNITVNIGTGTPLGTNSITNPATLNVPSYDLVPANNNANDPTTISGSADLSVTKTSASTFTVGQQATYTITMSNSASSVTAAASPITLTDQLPNGLTYVSGSGTNWTCPTAPAGPDVECIYNNSVAISASSTPLTITVSVTNTLTSPFTNFVSAFSPTLDPNTDNNTSQFTATLTSGTPNLLLVKRITAINGTSITGFVDDPATTTDNDSKWQTRATYLRGAIACNAGNACNSQNGVKPTDNVEYTIYFLSNGTENLKDVKICDRIPINTTFQTDTYAVGKGILLGWDSTVLADPTTSTGTGKVQLTNIADAPDKGQFISTPTTLPDPPCGLAANANGGVVVDVVSGATTVPKATAAGVVPFNSYGFVRFNVKVN